MSPWLENRSIRRQGFHHAELCVENDKDHEFHENHFRATTITGWEVRTLPWASVPSTENTW